jgi:hypothetical protein
MEAGAAATAFRRRQITAAVCSFLEARRPLDWIATFRWAVFGAGQGRAGADAEARKIDAGRWPGSPSCQWLALALSNSNVVRTLTTPTPWLPTRGERLAHHPASRMAFRRNGHEMGACAIYTPWPTARRYHVACVAHVGKRALPPKYIIHHEGTSR